MTTRNNRAQPENRAERALLAAVGEISRDICTGLDLEHTLELILHRLKELVDYCVAEICLWEESRQILTTRASAGDPGYTTQTGGSYHLDEGYTGWIARNQQPLLIPDTSARLDMQPKVLSEETPIRSYMGVPLKAGEAFLGTLALASDQRGVYNSDQLEILQVFADHTTVAIHNARLYEDTDQRLQVQIDQLIALQRISQELNVTLAPESILEVVLESAIQTSRATHGNVMLRDRETGQLGLIAAQGYSEEERAAIETTLLDITNPTLVAQVLENGQARILEDAEQEACIVCVRRDTRSVLVVPISYEGEIVGLINLRHTQVGAFDRHDLTFLQALAEQAAIAIGNAMRFEEQVRANTALRRQTEQMDGLLEVSRKLRADVPLDDTLEEIAYAIQETVGFNVVLISIVEDRGNGQPVLRRAAAAGLPLRVFEEAKGVRPSVENYQAILRDEYRQGECYFFPFQMIEDWGKDLPIVISMPEVDTWQEGQWHSHDMLLAPLQGAAGRLLGHISVDEPIDGRRPTHRTLEVLSIFANQAAIAVENASLYAAAQRRADNLALINEVARVLTQTLEPQQVLNTVVQAVGLLLECDLGVVFQEDPPHGRLKAVASYGVPLDALTALTFAPGDGLVGQVAQTGTRLLVPDMEQVPHAAVWPVPTASMALVPIKAGRQILGVLAAGCRDKHGLTQADQMLLTTLADQAAVALESARLFKAEARRRREAETLHAATQALSTTLNLQEIFQMILSELRQVVPYDSASVQSLEGTHLTLIGGHGFPNLQRLLGLSFDIEADDNPNHQVVNARAPVILEDAPAVYERFRQEPHAEASIRSWLGVPLLFGDRILGMITLDKREPGFYTPEHARLAMAFAAQAAIAVQNARLFQQSQRRVAELATVNEIARAISSALDSNQLCELIYNQVSSLLNARNFQIAFYDAHTGLVHVEFLVDRGQRQAPLILKSGQGLTGQLISSGQPMLVVRGNDEFLQEHASTLEREGVKSWLGVPMVAEDRVMGAIAVQSFDREYAFDADHLELLTTIAGQAAVAFQNATLFQERDRRITQLGALNRMAQALSSTLEMDKLLETVYQQASQLMDTTNFHIALYDEDKDEITFPFVVDPEHREDWSPRQGGEGLTGHIITMGRPLLLPTGAAGLYQDAEREVQAGLCRCWLGVPMVAEDKVLGVIALQSYSQEHIYDQGHLNLLSTLAAQAAVALRNAQLYQQIVRFSTDLEAMVEARTQDLEKALDDLTLERDRVETLYRITSELGTSLELERVLQRALQLLADALGIQHGTITLVDQETGQLEVQATLEELHWRHRKGERTPLKEGTGLAGWVLENRKPALVDDLTQDPRWMQIPGRDLPIRSALAAPLSLGGGDVLGVLTLGHPDIGHFTEEHLQLITAAASQVAIAVNNSDLYAFITDQAERVGTMLQAQQAESAKNRAVLESIADGVLVLDHNGRVLLVNPAAEEMLGFSAMVLQGEHFRHMLGLGETTTHRDLAQALYTQLRQRLEAAKQDAVQVVTSTVRLESGKRVLAVNFAPLIIDIGGLPGLVAALRDISREAEVERLKNEFISTVSHELRTPMTSIKGYTDLLFLGMAGGLSDPQRNFLQIIKANADRLTALVNDILDISRIETGRLRLTIEPLRLGEIVSQVVLAFQETYRDAELTLAWEEPKELPPVRGDAARVTQVLNNLLANACHYTLPGGQVRVSIAQTDGFLRVDVEDTGIGIAAEDVPRIFDRFYRVDHPVVQEAGGTGLGLSIVKMFVEMLGGEIWVESEPNVGSVFSFTLPLITADIVEPKIEQADLFTTKEPVTVMRRAKVLVVEDDRDLALLLRRQLESDGHQVLLAGSGEDALWLAREEQPQLITLDIMLPDMDGFAVLEQLKAHPITAPIPVVIVSIAGEAEKGYALGAVDYVVKPFEHSKLLETVRRAMVHVEQDRPGRVLVVDDDPDILGFLDQALSQMGYQVVITPNGQSALRLVKENPPDLILLDLKMPGLNGYEVIRRLQEEEATQPIPIIVITASPVDKERDRIQVLGMGATQYLTKPLSLETLLREIRSAIEERPLP